MRQLKITKQITQRNEVSINRYFQEINKYPMITAEEEVELSVRIKKGDRQINAKSILEVMGLGIDKGNKIIIKASGDKEKEAVETLANFIENELPHSDKEE